MNKLNFEMVKNKRKYHKLLESIMLPYCLELDSNVGRTTPEKTLKRFISSIVDMSENTDRFVELCYLDRVLIGFAYGKIDCEEHRGYVRPDWGYVMEFYVKPEYTDEKYFRLYHSLKILPEIVTDDFEITTATRRNIKTIVKIINDSYTDISVNTELIKSYTKTPVYNENLWIMVKEKATGKFAGCGLADYDTETKELVLEWIQVLPEYRGKKIGQLIVTELLFKMKGIADFATVSGKVDNETNPEALYRKCGFVGNDVWHILHRK